MSKEQRSGWRAFAYYGKQSFSKVRAAARLPVRASRPARVGLYLLPVLPSLAPVRRYAPIGFSSDTWKPGVRICAGPSAVMTITSSQRTPNSPGT